MITECYVYYVWGTNNGYYNTDTDSLIQTQYLPDIETDGHIFLLSDTTFNGNTIHTFGVGSKNYENQIISIEIVLY
jgi:hypothetical protein